MLRVLLSAKGSVVQAFGRSPSLHASSKPEVWKRVKTVARLSSINLPSKRLETDSELLYSVKKQQSNVSIRVFSGSLQLLSHVVAELGDDCKDEPHCCVETKISESATSGKEKRHLVASFDFLKQDICAIIAPLSSLQSFFSHSAKDPKQLLVQAESKSTLSNS